MSYQFINGGVTSPLGFTANGVCAGVKQATSAAITKAVKANESPVIPNGKRDLALIACDRVCSAAAIFTKNLVKSDTIYVTQKHLENGTAQAVIVNSGNANACNPDGYEKAEKMAALAAQALGIGEGAIDEAIKYTKERVQFKKRISSFQNTQFQLADMHTRMQAAQFLVYNAALKKQAHERCSMEAAMAKLFAAEAASDVTRRAVQLFGGYGYTREYPVERMMRDAKITEIYEGTSEVQRMVIAANLGVK